VIRAVVFDFDGVILDTETPDFISWQEVYVQHGVELTLETWAQGIGTYPSTFDVHGYLESITGLVIERDGLHLLRRARNDEMIVEEVIRPGIESWIEDAQRLSLKLGIASSSPISWVGTHLERVGLLSAFECIRCADHVDKTKPSPELYLAACEGLGVSPDEAIAVEDSPNGIKAATAAGLYCIGVPNSVTAKLDLTAADLCLDSLASLSLEDAIARSKR
jgi:HAD superfamily hydrolase (TIGR01509 family)